MNFSIVLVTYNRKNYLERCLHSIKNTHQIPLKFEVIIMFNGETSYLSHIKKKFPEYNCFYIPITTPADARNQAIEKCNGDYIFFLDDDCHLPVDYFNKIDFSKDWDVLGGPDRTPPAATQFEKNLGYALSSPFCTGLTYKRHSSDIHDINIPADEANLILCNLWFRKKIFTEEKNLFAIDLYRNEENFLLKQLKEKNKNLIYNAGLYVYHSRKSNLRALSVAITKSGECRVKNFIKLPSKRELIYLLPLLFSAMFINTILNPFSFLSIGIVLYTVLAAGHLFYKQRKIGIKVLLLHYHILFFYSFGLLIGIKKAILEEN